MRKPEVERIFDDIQLQNQTTTIPLGELGPNKDKKRDGRVSFSCGYMDSSVFVNTSTHKCFFNLIQISKALSQRWTSLPLALR